MNYTSREFLQNKDNAYVATNFNNNDECWPEYEFNIHDGSQTINIYDYASNGRNANEFMATLKTIRKHIDGLLEVMEANPIKEQSNAD